MQVMSVLDTICFSIRTVLVLLVHFPIGVVSIVSIEVCYKGMF